MTTLCSGGTSSAKPTAPTDVFLSGEVLTALIVEIFALPAEWAAVIAFAVGQSISLTSFCATDPPTLTWPSASDIAQILSQPWNPSTAGYQNLVSVVLNGAWHVFCNCDSVATPAPPTPPAYPSGAPSINPPGFGNSLSTPCWDVNTSVTVPPSTPVSNTNFSTTWLPGPLVSGMTGSGANLTQAPLIPPGVTTWQAKGSVAGSGTFTFGTTQAMFFYGSNKAFLSSVTLLTENFPGTYSFTQAPIAIPAGAVYWQLEANDNAANPSYSWQMDFSFFCNNQTQASPISPCCPPDPVMQAQLTQIINSLSTLNLLQRGLLPFAYVLGSAHSGLSSQGSFSVPSLLGIKIHLSTVPGSIGSEVGTPTYYFDVGWVSVLSADGLIEERRVTAVDMIWTPRIMSESTVVGYSFSAGVVATITEVEREA